MLTEYSCGLSLHEKGQEKGNVLVIQAALMNGWLHHAPGGSLPSEQKKVVTAKSTAAGLEKPLENRLHGISHAYPSKIDGSAVRAACGEEAYRGANHELTPAFTARVAAGAVGLWDGVE